jgi:hypothetical protein
MEFPDEKSLTLISCDAIVSLHLVSHQQLLIHRNRQPPPYKYTSSRKACRYKLHGPKTKTISAKMYSQRPTTASTLPIRKISPKSIGGKLSSPPCTPENWQHLVSIVMKLVQDKQIKDSVVSDLAARMTNLETSMDHGMSSTS